MMFPKVIAEIIGEYCATPCLLPWVDKSKLNKDMLMMNLTAWEAGMVDVSRATPSTRRFIAMNPAAKDHILANMDTFRYDPGIWANSALADTLIAMMDDFRKRGWKQPHLYIWTNPNPQILAYLLEHFTIDWEYLSMNPVAIDVLRRNRAQIDKDTICANSAAIDIIQELYPNGSFTDTAYSYLIENSHPWAVEQIRELGNLYNHTMFYANTGMFHHPTNPALVAKLTAGARD